MHIIVSLLHINFSAAEVPYSIIVKAINLAGCGEENQTYCFIQEGGKQFIDQRQCIKVHIIFLFHFSAPSTRECYICEI